jgi:Flp pilus assembly protein TadD
VTRRRAEAAGARGGFAFAVPFWACVACASATGRSEATAPRAPIETSPTAANTTTPRTEPGAGTANPTLAQAPVPALAKAQVASFVSASTQPAVTTGNGAPSRQATIRLSSGKGGPGDAYLAAGDDAFERGDLAEAQKRYDAARKAVTGSVAAEVGLARVRVASVDVPLDYASAKDNPVIVAAAADLARLAKRSPAFAPTYVELGRCRLLLGDAPGAIDALVVGTRLSPDEPEAHSQLGVALLATGRAAESVRELSRAAELDPGNAARHGNLGTALLMLGRTKEAIAEYETRARMNDGDARAHSDLGTALLGTADSERALSELQRAVALDPARPAFHSNLGYALQETGRPDRAVTEYREALRLDSKLVSAWINLGTVLAHDPATRAKARDAFERARTLSPDDPRVKANLEELDAVAPGKPKATP